MFAWWQKYFAVHDDISEVAPEPESEREYVFPHRFMQLRLEELEEALLVRLDKGVGLLLRELANAAMGVKQIVRADSVAVENNINVEIEKLQEKLAAVHSTARGFYPNQKDKATAEQVLALRDELRDFHKWLSDIHVREIIDMDGWRHASDYDLEVAAKVLYARDPKRSVEFAKTLFELAGAGHPRGPRGPYKKRQQPNAEAAAPPPPKPEPKPKKPKDPMHEEFVRTLTKEIWDTAAALVLEGKTLPKSEVRGILYTHHAPMSLLVICTNLTQHGKWFQIGHGPTAEFTTDAALASKRQMELDGAPDTGVTDGEGSAGSAGNV